MRITLAVLLVGLFALTAFSIGLNNQIEKTRRVHLNWEELLIDVESRVRRIELENVNTDALPIVYNTDGDCTVYFRSEGTNHIGPLIGCKNVTFVGFDSTKEPQ